MTIEAFSIIQNEGEIIMHRDYTTRTTTAELLTLRSFVMSGGISEPIFQLGSRVYAHKKFLVFNMFAQIGAESDAMAAVYFLEQVYKIIIAYYSPSVSSDNIRSTEIWFEEMLDELVDNGQIATTDPEVLDLFLKPVGRSSGKDENPEESITIEATKQLNYRAQNIFYKINEISLTLIEKLNVLFSASGEVLEADVRGQIDVLCHLSGMPDCELSLNDRQLAMGAQTAGPGAAVTSKQVAAVSSVILDDVWFHNCVRLANFAEKREITFCPPDGEFTVMNFRISEGIRAPIVIKAHYEPFGRNRAIAKLSISANLPQSVIAEGLKVFVPMPANLINVNVLNVKEGKAKQHKTGEYVEWRIGSIQSGIVAELEIEMNTAVAVNEDLREWKRPPIKSEFEIMMYAASGVEIRVFSVNMGNIAGDVVKKLNTITTSGNYFSKW